MPIQGLHGREADRADLLEGLLCRGLTPGGILAKLTHRFLEALVRALKVLTSRRFGVLSLNPQCVISLPPLRVCLLPPRVGAPAIVAHLDAQVTELAEDAALVGVQRLPVLLAGHDPTLSRRGTAFNVSSWIQTA